jgi:hypothetical protein
MYHCYELLCLWYVKLNVPPLLSVARSSTTQSIDGESNRRRKPPVLSRSVFLRVALSVTGFSGEVRPRGLIIGSRAWFYSGTPVSKFSLSICWVAGL